MPRLTDDEVRQRYGLPPGTRIVWLTPDELGRVTVEPNTFAVVTVKSAFEWAVWDRPTAVAGTTATLTVQGRMVGEGAPLEVDVTDGRGRRLARAGGPMYRDRARVEVPIPREAEGVAIAEVRLAKPRLKVTSRPLVVLPYAELDRARWGAERVVEGEAVGLSCRVTGSAAGANRLEGASAEVAVFVRTEDGAAPLDEPVVVLRAPVDRGRVEVQWRATLALERWDLLSQAELDAEAARRGFPVGQPPYVYDRPRLVFRVRLAGLEAESGPLDVDDWFELSHAVGGEPAAGRAYELTLADGTVRTGTLDAEGLAREEGLPPGTAYVVYEPDSSVPPPTDDEPAAPRLR